MITIVAKAKAKAKKKALPVASVKGAVPTNPKAIARAKFLAMIAAKKKKKSPKK